jgi:hypothetical protein
MEDEHCIAIVAAILLAQSREDHAQPPTLDVPRAIDQACILLAAAEARLDMMEDLRKPVPTEPG